MRQVALILLMAQCGSFVPAKEVRLTPVDRIFSRVGASDDLASGHSTFMVEMTEVAHILKHSTSNSFIILDEIGRGTSTFDGMSIARSVIEYIKEKLHSRTIFATHYHELTILENWRQGIRNRSMAVKERGNEIQFLRRVIDGGADKSYGVHVAQLAGLPRKVVERAHQLLTEMEENPVRPNSVADTLDKSDCKSDNLVSPSLFSSTLPDELIALDIDTITPLEAINILHRLHLQARREAGKT
jgi:DNA mismatch repair protein MutS